MLHVGGATANASLFNWVLDCINSSLDLQANELHTNIRKSICQDAEDAEGWKEREREMSGVENRKEEKGCGLMLIQSVRGCV